MLIKTLEDLRQEAIKIGPKVISVANPAEDEIFEALQEAYQQKMIRGFLVGDRAVIAPLASKHGLDNADFQIIHVEGGELEAARAAVKLVHDKQAQFLMKGTVATAYFLKAVLDKEIGLRSADRLLSHVAIFQVAGYDRLLLLTDAAFNIKPTLEEKALLIDNAVRVAQALGIEKPKVACVTAIEKVNPKMPSTVEAAELAKMAREGRFPNALVEGPFGLDNAVDAQAAEIKGVKGDVAGKADIILAPDMDSANVIYKSLGILTRCPAAAIVVGTEAPVVLTSRADSSHTKLLSLALGAMIAHYYYSE